MRRTSVAVTLSLLLHVGVGALVVRPIGTTRRQATHLLSTTTSSSSSTSSSLIATLQQCVTPEGLLQRVARPLGFQACHGEASGDYLHINALIWTRLCKQLVALDNQQRYANEAENCSERDIDAAAAAASLPLLLDCDGDDDAQFILHRLLSRMPYNHQSIGSLVDATKAASVVIRILVKNQPTDMSSNWLRAITYPLMNFWSDVTVDQLKAFEPHQLSGLFWALEGLRSMSASRGNYSLPLVPSHIERAYHELGLPFRIHPNLCANVALNEGPSALHLNVDSLLSQVSFASGDEATIKTNQGLPVLERRRTAWQGETSVGPFLYSGKSMRRQDWSPLVQTTRDALKIPLGIDYDCCLINHYYDGTSAMRYHSDPDQGTLWEFDTAVVSIGATRRFAFRENADSRGRVHSFWVMDGDVTHMFGNCQQTYQHTVKKADAKGEVASRASLVFKKSLGGQT
ncbi:hypothetical protein MPSEU_000417700 [Mayamaea pseudoterrestris]|nr:hypothetical protein MPSEU_000417700 [Mayamaea pseudoterrestris]